MTHGCSFVHYGLHFSRASDLAHPRIRCLNFEPSGQDRVEAGAAQVGATVVMALGGGDKSIQDRDISRAQNMVSELNE